MSFFSKNEDFDIYENFPDYEKTSPYNIKTRTITDSEYLSIPFYYKSKLKTLLTVPGMVLILLSIIAIWSITLSICDVVKGEPKAVMYLFICCMVNLFLIAITLNAYSERVKQVITKDQKVAPGEVVHILSKRSTRNVTLGAYHTIALHGSKQVVTIFARRVKRAGENVLVVVNPPPESPFLIIVPKNSLDYDLSLSQNNIKEQYFDLSEFTDYTGADLESVADHISYKEYKKIIGLKRLQAPFKYGALSTIWMFFTIVTIVLAVTIINGFFKMDAEVFFPLVIGFLCELIIEHFLCKIVFKKNNSSFKYGVLDCVIAKKIEDEHINEKNIRAVIPERKQFVNLKITPYDYKRLSLNERVKFIVNISVGEVVSIIRE